MKFASLLLFCAYLSLSLAKDYTNYKVYDVTPRKDQMEDFMSWEFDTGIDILGMGGPGRVSKVMVSPDLQTDFTDFLKRNGIKFETAIENMEPLLQQEKADRISRRSRRKTFADDDVPTFENYLTFDEMDAYTVHLATEYPHLVTRDIIGKSVEGRDMIGVRVSTAAEFGKKPIIFIDSGVHAREWVGPHSALYFLTELVTNAAVTAELLEKVDFAFVPNANPDGYTWAMNEDRLWRKNRRYFNESCTGVDLNRNFRYVWQYGANSCSGTGHPGPSPVSEPETEALVSYMDGFKHNLKLYLSTHSFGNYVLWPFGFEFDVYIKNWKEHMYVADLFVNEILGATGTSYRPGNSADILYTANGASDDHAVAYANAQLAYTLELTGGTFGFDYPAELARALAAETFLGYRQMALYIAENYYFD